MSAHRGNSRSIHDQPRSSPLFRTRNRPTRRACSSHGREDLHRVLKPTLLVSKECFPLDARQWGFIRCRSGGRALRRRRLVTLNRVGAPRMRRSHRPPPGPPLEGPPVSRTAPRNRPGPPGLRWMGTSWIGGSPDGLDSNARLIPSGTVTSSTHSGAEVSKRCRIRGMVCSFTVPLLSSRLARALAHRLLPRTMCPPGSRIVSTHSATLSGRELGSRPRHRSHATR